LSKDAVAECLASAVAAPSIHNSQPWRFEVRGSAINVLADAERRLDVLDPSGRQLLMSVGAAVLNLRVAMLAHGRLPVLRLFPYAGRPTVIARVTSGPAAIPDRTATTLAAAINRRHTNRLPFKSMAIPDQVIDDLIGAAAGEGARLAFAPPVVRDAIFGLTQEADERFRGQASYLAELGAWIGGPPDRRDGVPPSACGPRDRRQRLPLRDFGLANPYLDPGTAEFEQHPVIVVLTTPGDSRYHWARAGQALQRVLLTATARDLAATLMNQSLEIPELRRLLTDQRAARYAQAILRIGYGPAVPATPRRGLGEVLVTRPGTRSRAPADTSAGTDDTDERNASCGS
jgi:hypothetical protein